MSIDPPAGKAQGKTQGACAVAVPLPEMGNDGKAASWASAEGGPTALRCSIAGSACPSVAVAGSEPVKEAVIRGGAWTTMPRLPEAGTEPAPFPAGRGGADGDAGAPRRRAGVHRDGKVPRCARGEPRHRARRRRT